MNKIAPEEQEWRDRWKAAPGNDMVKDLVIEYRGFKICMYFYNVNHRTHYTYHWGVEVKNEHEEVLAMISSVETGQSCYEEARLIVEAVRQDRIYNRRRNDTV